MPVIVDPALANVPLGWMACDAQLKKFTPPAAMGFNCEPGDLNRFRARYRLAKSFQSIALETYTAETVAGYSALLRVFLTYSSFEQFLDCCGLTLSGIEPDLKPYRPADVEAAIRSVDRYAEFLNAVLQHLDRASHRAQLEAFLNGRPCNVLYIPAAIRHIFAHGKLTPNSGAGFTAPPQQIASIVVDFLFGVMDGEFARRLREHGIPV